MPMPTLTRTLTAREIAGLDSAACIAGLDNEHRARLVAWAEQARAANALLDSVLCGDALPEFDTGGHLHFARAHALAWEG